MLRQIVRLAASAAMIGGMIVGARYFGAVSCWRMGWQMAIDQDDFPTSRTAEASRLANCRFERQVRRDLDSTTVAKSQVARAISDLEGRLGQQLGETAAATELAEQLRERYRSAAANDQWPVEFHGRTYTRDELETQLKELLTAAGSSRLIAEQLRQLKDRLVSQQVKLTVEEEYIQVKLRSLPVLPGEHVAR